MDVRVVTAGAGCGKTWHLTRQLATWLRDGADPDSVLATTFTEKAAKELITRARRALMEDGQWEAARLIETASIGTVNAMGSRLLKEFAFELGLSPQLDVMPESDALTFLHQALGAVFVEEPYASHLAQTAWALSLDEKLPYLKQMVETWVLHVQDLINLARQNGISPERLPACAERSLEEMLPLLGEVHDDPEASNRRLQDEVRRLIERLPAQRPGSAAEDCITRMEQALHDFERRGNTRWTMWTFLANCRIGDETARVNAAARNHRHHAHLHRDVATYLHTVFHFAERGLERYRDFKADHRLMDYIDQEERMLELLDLPCVQERLRERVQLLLVDEFQDTSPIQLAIFLKLAKLAQRVVWVGDSKQSIYGFRGVDPQLMRACLESLPAGEPLRVCRRARPDLVRLVSDSFAPVFGDEVRLHADRSDRAEFGSVEAPPATSVWTLDVRNNEEEARAIALGIRQFLASDTPIVDPVTRLPRPVRAGDVAALCRKNDTCIFLANALAALQIPSAIKRPGLLDTPEGTLTMSALRLLVDASDTLAAGTIAMFDLQGAATRDHWLDERLRQVEKCDDRSKAWKDHPRVARLRAVRPRMRQASPQEALELAIREAGLIDLCIDYGLSEQRLNNLEAFRGHASAYEEHCRVHRTPATVAGLVQFLESLHQRELDLQSADAGQDAVTVITYFRAKGLEWPVVVLCDLDEGERRQWEGFSAQANAPKGPLNMDDPLAGRGLRLWPYPFGLRTANVDFIQRARDSAIGKAVDAQRREESLRLLYVGFTRARDHLVFAARVRRDGTWQTPWLDELPGFSLDHSTSRRLVLTVSDEPVLSETASWYERKPLPADVERGVFAPTDKPTVDLWHAADKFTLGPRLLLRARDGFDRLGDVLHGFLAADSPVFPEEERLRMAERLLASFDHVGSMAPADLLAASSRLSEFLERRYPGARWLRECPLCYREGDKEVWGQADLLLECLDGWVVVDHKTYPGRDVEEQVGVYAGQLQAYVQGVELATGQRVKDVWLHFAVLGRMVRVVRVAARSVEVASSDEWEDEIDDGRELPDDSHLNW